ncbi:hypothetical protein LSUE1_G002859 [Lachnellula suecica]|uniref:Extracellular membrane protein CFEM domain-containing protein n=1 Tax=Lachnellula suecica TaxID=602035 RepID=A0A8T9CA97_9HELO|nr:hypothetical protein LSUE1_G002859 [Lachnellula suecica]
MRPSPFGLLATAAVVSAMSTSCANDNFDELLIKTSCGDNSIISKCIREQVGAFRLEEISPCFIAGGCKKKDAVWFMQECNMVDTKQDLKKRATDDSTTADKTTATTAKTSATKVVSTSAASTKASSTAAASGTTASVSTASPTAVSTDSSSSTSSGSTSGSSSVSTSSAGVTSANTCSTTWTTSASACTTSGQSVSCTPTTLAASSCIASLLCFPSIGPDSCMERNAPLTTSGIVVSAVFGLGISATIIVLIVMCLKARSKANRDNRERAALLAGVNSKPAMKDVELSPYNAGGPGAGVSDSNLPLVTPGGVRSEQTGYSGTQQEYFGQQGGGYDVGVSPGSHSQGVPQIQLGQLPHWSDEHNNGRL